MRSPFAYTPRPGRLQVASPAAAIAYLGALVAIAFLYASPVVLAAVGIGACLAGTVAGARRAVRASLRMGLTLALLIVVVNGLVVDRGETVLARLGEWPLLGRVDVTGEALAAGATIGLRAAVAIVAFAVYSACVDPDRVLRALRPFAGRSALTASLISRLVPVAAADAARLRDAGRLRGPAAAPLGRAVLARRLLTGSLDRAVDVAATLELRGYGLPVSDAAPGGVLGRPVRVTQENARSPHRSPFALARLGPTRANLRLTTRYDARFYAVGIALLIVAIAGKLLGADDYSAYPTVEIGVTPATLAVSAVAIAAGVAPFRRRRRSSRARAEVRHA